MKSPKFQVTYSYENLSNKLNCSYDFLCNNLQLQYSPKIGIDRDLYSRPLGKQTLWHALTNWAIGTDKKKSKYFTALCLQEWK